MATVREKSPLTRITERIPHKGVAYAYVELEASNANEFEKLRAEALANPALSHYAFAAKAPATVASTDSEPVAAAAAAEEPVEVTTAESRVGTSAQVEASAPAAVAPTSDPKEKARERARALLLEKRKGA